MPTGFPVFPLLVPAPQPGEDAAGDAADFALGARRRIEGVTFGPEAVVLIVAAREDDARWYGALGVDPPVFAGMLEHRGGLDRVVGAAIRLERARRGLELRFGAPPRRQALERVALAGSLS